MSPSFCHFDFDWNLHNSILPHASNVNKYHKYNVITQAGIWEVETCNYLLIEMLGYLEIASSINLTFAYTNNLFSIAHISYT